MDKDKINLVYTTPLKEALRVALVYLALSIIWIIFTDDILLKFVAGDLILLLKLQTYKGVAFVCISSLIVFTMVYHRVSSLTKLTDELEQEKILSQAKLDYIDLHDSSTGLPKRILLEKHFLLLTEGLYKDKKIALVHVEIDNFTQINETIGNVAGDQFMLHLSLDLDKKITGDSMLARLNQGAFGILLTDIESKEDIDKQVKEILEIIERPWIYDGREFFMTATAGIATYPDDCTEFYCQLRYSNIALRYAKLKNRGMFEYYSNDIEEETLMSLDIVDNIKKGIINNEFKLNYQIVLDLQSKSVAGVEALIRWHHPEVGNIAPLDFIPIAEQSNLIMGITELVINMALEQKNIWKVEQQNVPKISINISPKSMNTVGFCYYIEDKLQEYNVNGHELILELTESTFIEDVVDLDANIKYLRNIGVEIALDDFGTGYSTLARLKDLNIDYLKLDRTFIMNMTKDSNDFTLVKSVIDIANILNISVCAEGIETMEGFNLLAGMGCSLGQGYLIHKPSDKLPLNFKYDL